MAVQADKHKFTNADTDSVLKLGCTFDGIAPTKFAVFMRKNFPGFNLVLLLQQIENLLVRHAVTPVSRSINVEDDALQILLENIHTSEDDALIFDRIFYNEKGSITISHEYLVLPKPARNNGLSKKVLKASLEQYKKMDADTVKVVAGLSTGALIWATYGFVAVNKSEMENILKRAEDMLNNKDYKKVEAIFNNYYIKKKGVHSFPIKRWALLPFMEKVLKDAESQWEGRLDLKDKKQLRKFEDYVSK